MPAAMASPVALDLPPRSRVLVAMSGGVDSSVAAALVHEAGHEVVGVTLHLWDASGAERVGRCCAPEDRDDARRTCELLGVPHYVLDEREAFRSTVVDRFVDDNLAGLTPSPCVHCNQYVKLGRLDQLATRLGASHVATGHYARLARGADGAMRLLRGRDVDKDQSYFLFGVEPHVLERLVFPLGGMTKQEARAHAQRLGLPNWNKPDSQELCFVPDGDVRGFIGRQERTAAGTRAGTQGPVLDEAGRELGRHAGIEGFTVGQRRGVGIAGSEPRYVLRVVKEDNAVVLGPAASLLRERFEATVRIRHRHTPAAALIAPSGDGFDVELRAPERAVAPGQAAVIYRGDEVVGGGFIV